MRTSWSGSAPPTGTCSTLSPLSGTHPPARAPTHTQHTNTRKCAGGEGVCAPCRPLLSLALRPPGPESCTHTPTCAPSRRMVSAQHPWTGSQAQATVAQAQKCWFPAKANDLVLEVNPAPPPSLPLPAPSLTHTPRGQHTHTDAQAHTASDLAQEVGVFCLQVNVCVPARPEGDFASAGGRAAAASERPVAPSPSRVILPRGSPAVARKAHRGVECMGAGRMGVGCKGGDAPGGEVAGACAILGFRMPIRGRACGRLSPSVAFA